jgi:hypothetical protein
MPAPKMVCLSYKNGGESKLVARHEGMEIAAKILRRGRSAIHHSPFDTGVVAAEDPSLIEDIFRAHDEGRVYCSKITEMMLDNAKGQLKFLWNEEDHKWERQSFSLADLIMRRLGRDVFFKKKAADKESGGSLWRLRFNELDGVPVDQYPVEAAEYAKSDADEHQAVFESQCAELGGRPDVEIPGYVATMQSAWVLSLLSTWGVRTDPVAVEKFRREVRAGFTEQVAICRELGLRRGGIKQSRDMVAIRAEVERWHKRHGLDMDLTKKGEISTTREQLTRPAPDGSKHPGLVAVAESVRLEKLDTTYGAALERGTVVPLNPAYNPILETFRTSCSNGMKIDGVPVGFNPQVLPRGGDVRQCVIPREGNVFAFSDLDTVEMRSLAQTCIDLGYGSRMAEAFRAGADTHVMLAAEILERSYRDVFDDYKRGDRAIEESRQFSKIGNYGMMGAMGVDAFVDYAKSNGQIVSRSLAERIHAGFRRTWPEVLDFFGYVSFLCDEGDCEHLVHPRTGYVRGKVRYTAAANHHFQHLTAVAAKAALYQVCRECYVDAGSPLYGSRPWLFNHDEVGIEIPYAAIGPERASAAALRLQQVMIERVQVWHPDVPIGAGIAMSRRWFKGCKEVRKNGLIVPARPALDGKKKIWVPDLERLAA